MTITDPIEHLRAARDAFNAAAGCAAYAAALRRLGHPDTDSIVEQTAYDADFYSCLASDHLRNARDLEQEAAE
ncbi:hypothetical protein [Corynebacterium pygosceleis]|uniref:hypothetical protein n=1 Tax=Corynebacterium pygosceleis TaxID=2800406 RepID=UPI002003BBB0|nr:hypothetical protein [Corynebacterium pygosceleis]MCK7676385.1 hypothetical protein [Corynebacterium pygosceleis]